MGEELKDTSADGSDVDTSADMSDSGKSFDDSSMDAGDEAVEDAGSEGLVDSGDSGMDVSGESIDDNSMEAGDELVDDSDTEGLNDNINSDETSHDAEEPVDTDAPTDDTDSSAEEEGEVADNIAEDLPDGDAEGTNEPADKNGEENDNGLEESPGNDESSQSTDSPADENAEAADNRAEGLPAHDEPATDTDEPVDRNTEATDDGANDLPENKPAGENAESIDNGAEALLDGDTEKNGEPAVRNAGAADSSPGGSSDGPNDAAESNPPNDPDDVLNNTIPQDSDDGTDWDRTSLTPEQEKQLRDMEDAGEIDIPQEDPDWVEPTHKDAHLPTDKTGSFDGERGNSAFRPNNEAAQNKMGEYGRDAVEYKNGNPDFSPFTLHDTPYGKMDGQVEIPHMTDNRENPSWEYGRRPAGTSHDPNYDLGNFAQADNELSKKMGNMTPEQVESYRKANNLTWHECPDGKTMQLVPMEIHDACRHSGGVSEQKYRQAMGDITAPSL